jgi:hypothetical protein
VADPDGEISAILWRPDGSNVLRSMCASIDAVVEATAALWPGAEIIRADDEPQNWL